MKVHHHIDSFDAVGPVVLTQGTFDGVHYGHQQILKRVVAEARACNGESVLLTFYPHPRLVLYPNDNDLKLLNTLEEKIALVEALGIDHLVVLPFTKEFSRISPEQFVSSILINKLRIRKMIIGYDHRFGRNREGSLKDMQRYAAQFNFSLEEIPAQDIEDCIVSSTKIRTALLSGDVVEARALLGRPYSVKGTVVHGSKKGKELGYPTANIEVDSKFKLIPSNGVYAVKAQLGGKEFGGMLNIGDNPTFHDKKWSIEVHIFEFSGDAYNQSIEIAFIEKMRNEMKYSSVDLLIEQMRKDEVNARNIIETI